jgi:hypothetical protein
LRGASVVAAVFAALLWAGGAPAAPNPVVVQDELGDSEDAPDIVDASVVADRAGRLVFRVRLASAPELTPGDRLVSVFVDADRDEFSGPEGMEHVLRVDGSGARLEAWIDAMYQPVEAAAAGGYADGLVTVAVPRSRLGGTRALDFRVVASEGDIDVEGTTDSAPDLEPATYVVPRPRRIEAAFRPIAPRTGSRFAVSSARIALSDGSMDAATRFSCTALVGGRPLRPSARCAWRIPAGTARRALVVVVSATWAGEPAPPRTYRLRIR